MEITIVLADDHQVVRNGLKTLLEGQGLKVIGEASDGQEATELTEQLHPTVLVADLMMSGMNGLEVTRHVTQNIPGTAVIILSMYGNEGYVLEALRAGARGYVLKESSTYDLVHAVREAAAGRRYLGAPLSELAIEAYIHKTESTPIDPYDTLTTREREVLYLSAQGFSNTETAAKLFISRRTVEIHRNNMMRKLGLHNQAELLRYALQRGIFPPRPDSPPARTENHPKAENQPKQS